MKFNFLNDTGRIVNICPATFAHGCKTSNAPIYPLEEQLFVLPKETYPWVKMWDNAEKGLTILVSPVKDVD